MTQEELTAYFQSLGQPKYRAAQVFAWIHRGVRNFQEMSDLPASLRDVLEKKAQISFVSVAKKLVSDIDGTVKYLYELNDGESVESVLMSYKHGFTVCISTQAGCRMNCAFCASSLAGLSRGLTPSEMLDQVLYTQTDAGQRISNVVLMGIGEPLDNYDHVMKFLKLLSAPGGLNIGLRHVSLSTCGLVDQIRRLETERLQLTLSVSLHAPNDEIRSKLMPVNRKWNMNALLDACRDYTQATGRRISFEYALVGGVNDSAGCARELGEKLKGMLCHVNLIPVNTVAERGLDTSSDKAVRHFSEILSGYGLTVTVRRTLGADINASCGQLRYRHGTDKGGNPDVNNRQDR